MTVEDVMPAGEGLAVLSGPLLLQGIIRNSDLREAVGSHVLVMNAAGIVTPLRVRDVFARQTMSGATQVSLGVELPTNAEAITRGCLVSVKESPQLSGSDF